MLFYIGFLEVKTNLFPPLVTSAALLLHTGAAEKPMAFIYDFLISSLKSLPLCPLCPALNTQ